MGISKQCLDLMHARRDDKVKEKKNTNQAIAKGARMGELKKKNRN